MALKSKSLDQVRSDVPLFKEEDVRLNLVIPMSVKTRWKVEAAQRHKDLSKMIIEAMNAYLESPGT